MKFLSKTFFFIPILVFVSCTLSGQTKQKLDFLEYADTLHKGRLWTSAAIGTSLYTGVMIGLNEAWYAEHPRSSFHFFNDMGEWNDMDKVGHLFSTYKQSNWVFQGALWTGMKRRKSMWLAAIVANIWQGSIETLDGFSTKWGFSLGDIGFNMAGSALFIGQELAWQDQRIIMKFSSHYKNYPETILYNEENTTTIRRRAHDLYGSSFAESFLKDYNGQTYWLSANIHSFLPNKKSKIPKWLNIAVGYGGENMLGGFENRWEEDGVYFETGPNVYPRYRQFYLSLDIDLTRIPIKNKFLRTIVNMANLLKIPAPALEINTLGNVRFHPIYF